MLVVTVALAIQVTIRVGSDEKSDSARRARRDSIRAEIDDRVRERNRRPPRRIPLTPELERSAFLDPRARDLLLSAREARMRQDSSLRSYDAMSYERVSAGLGFRAMGRDRLLFRTENASHVRWSRDGGAWIELKGKRTVFPTFGEHDADADLDDPAPLPYFPGREALLFGSNTAKPVVDERELVHPLAIGSEAYYRYSTGDSISITLPDGKIIRLRELRVEPRRPEWRLSVGSFWFDVQSGQLVRAVYRLAVPMDIWAVAEEETRRDREDSSAKRRKSSDDDDVPRWVKGLMSPLQANLEAVTVEYGLFGTRYWLPRAQYAEGWARAGIMRIPFKLEQSFKYASVNGDERIPPVPNPGKAIRDSLFPGDSTPLRDLPSDERRRRTRAIAEAAAARAKAREAVREEECAKTGFHTETQTRYEGAVRIAIQIPCDTTKLATSPELPPSIYDPGEELFGLQQRDELLKALDFSLQSGWAPQRPLFQYGLALTRYNRVEGFSTGIGASMELGRGYAVDGRARLGTGDWEPNAELGIARTNGRTTWRLGVQRRLAVASDWGPEPSFGGLGALLFGRDESFYYRTMGLELERHATRGNGLSLRLFAEHDSPVEVTTRFNVAHALGGGSEFGPNFDARRGNTFGAALRDTRTFGLDPNGWRAFTQILLEGGWFDPKDTISNGGAEEGHAFSRAAGDVTVSRGLGSHAAAALTVAGGVTDHVPPQRTFFLGGTRTVRGQLAGTAVGDSYWLGRLELGAGAGPVRPVVFGDLGWAGRRAEWRHPGRPLSGAGVGFSFIDGLIRADLARGIYPREKLRFDMYLEARF
jgi:hypothetical protein